jgi:GTP pyrophosphokinase
VVTVTQRPSDAAAPARPALEPALAGLDAAERTLVERAEAFAVPLYDGKLLGTGEPALDHAHGLTANLAQLRADAATRAAGLLFAAPEYLSNADEQLATRIDPAVAALVSGVSKLNRMRVVTRGLAATAEKGKQSQAEILRKMLLGMVEDIRVVLIRLASRTQTLRFLARAPEEARREVARETLDIYAPLANRLGVWQLKWELEDLSFRFLEPELYKRIARQLDERRDEREAFIAEARATLSRAIGAAGITAEVTGRPKHIYSIYTKMRQKGLEFAELHDVRGLRVLVGTVKDCYGVLGIAHDLWQPIPQEFDDYISRPKGNDYRSLHTAVVGPDGRALEVQIRTHEMHRHAELGVAAHWRYKEGRARGDAFDDKIAWLRQVLAWRDEIVDAAEWVEQSKRAALDEAVYVLTPQGKVIDLPRGATPIDFAYALHTDLGHRCRGAKVDGAMVPLDYKLANGQRVEIVAAKTGGPSRDWLNPQLGYLASSRARHKVRQWFNSEELARTIAAGRAAVERELAREGATGVKLETLAERLGFTGTDDFFAAVGREEVGPRALQAALRGPAPVEPQAEETLVAKKSRAGAGGAGVLFVGVDRLMTQLARCCKPVPPDAIAGFVTRGRGISVHRRDCRSLAYLLARQPERGIEAQWGERAASVFPVDIAVQAHDRPGLLRDVSEVLSRERINVTAANTQSRRHIATMFFTAEVEDLDHLRRALAQIADVPGVFSASRR